MVKTMSIPCPSPELQQLTDTTDLSALCGTSFSGDRETSTVPSKGLVSRIAKAFLRRGLERLDHGVVEVISDNKREKFGKSTDAGLHASVRVHDERFFRRLLTGGSLAAADSFVDGEWSTDDLVSLIRIVARNIDAMDSMEQGLPKITTPIRSLFPNPPKSSPGR